MPLEKIVLRMCLEQSWIYQKLEILIVEVCTFRMTVPLKTLSIWYMYKRHYYIAFFFLAANSFCKNIRIESKTDHSLLPKVVNDSLGCYYLIGSNNDTLTNTMRPIYSRMDGNNSRLLHQCNDNNDMIWRGTVIFSSIFSQ